MAHMNDKPDLSASLRWVANISESERSSHSWEQTLALIPPHERKSVQTYAIQQDRQRTLLGKIMIRKACSSFTGVEFDKVDIKRTKEGKPYLNAKNHRGLNFNLSHHGDWVFFGMEQRGLIGVDVASTAAPRKGTTADAYFACFGEEILESEWRSIRAGVTDAEKFFAFAVIWALKESFVKAVGIGMGFGLERLEFKVSPRLLDLGWWTREGGNGGVLHRDGVQVRVDGKRHSDWEFELGVLPGQDGAAARFVLATALGPFAEATPSFRAALQLPSPGRRISQPDCGSAFRPVTFLSHEHLLPSPPDPLARTSNPLPPASQERSVPLAPSPRRLFPVVNPPLPAMAPPVPAARELAAPSSSLKAEGLKKQRKSTTEAFRRFVHHHEELKPYLVARPPSVPNVGHGRNDRV